MGVEHGVAPLENLFRFALDIDVGPVGTLVQRRLRIGCAMQLGDARSRSPEGIRVDAAIDRRCKQSLIGIVARELPFIATVAGRRVIA
jgi:hypothetical protein